MFCQMEFLKYSSHFLCNLFLILRNGKLFCAAMFADEKCSEMKS